MSAPQTTFARARRPRREMTLPEVLLWRALCGKALDGLRFRKQHPISECVLDFYLPSARLAVEVDGQAHDRGGIPSRDARRDAWLAGRGIKVLRVPASEVLDQDGLDSVLRLIAEEARVRLGSACVPPSVRCADTPPQTGEDWERPATLRADWAPAFCLRQCFATAGITKEGAEASAYDPLRTSAGTYCSAKMGNDGDNS
jgi:very-short-patch-repair endonuclease